MHCISRRVMIHKKQVTKFNSFAELWKIPVFLKFKHTLRAAHLFHISTKSPNYYQYAHKSKVPGLCPGHILRTPPSEKLKIHPKIGACGGLLFNSSYKCRVQVVESKKINIKTWEYNEDIRDFSPKLIMKSI